MKKKVLITNSYDLQHTDTDLRQNVEIISTPFSKGEQLLPLVGDVHGIVAHNTVIEEKHIGAAPLLQLISIPQVGYDKIDLAAATKAGVAVIANIGLASGSVAEFTLGLMITLARRIVKACNDLRGEKNWSARVSYLKQSLEMGTDLRGATVGLVGFGAIGAEVAGLCQRCFNARVIAYDPFVGKESMDKKGVEKTENLVDMAKQVDFLSVHATLSAATKHLIDESVFRIMKPEAFFINCARGALVDEAALAKALEQKWIAGAAVDVFEVEPVTPDNPLLKLDNIIVTPHLAGITKQSSFKRAEILVKGIMDAFAGKRPEGLVNPEVWSNFLERQSGSEETNFQ